MNKFRILIADDHEVVRKGARSLLESRPDWEVCGEAGDGREAVEMSLAETPDLVLMDIGMPRLNGLEAARQISSVCPQVRILILTIHGSEQVVREALAVGARGFLLKTDLGRELVTAIETLQRDRTYFTPQIAELTLTQHRREVPSMSLRGRLTPREREVVQLLAEGKTSKEVAVTLELSVKTAETHRTNIMRKLDLHSVADLTLYAVRNGLVHVV